MVRRNATSPRFADAANSRGPRATTDVGPTAPTDLAQTCVSRPTSAAARLVSFGLKPVCCASKWYCGQSVCTAAVTAWLSSTAPRSMRADAMHGVNTAMVKRPAAATWVPHRSAVVLVIRDLL